jgi:plasmid stabilization system protein ParE
LKVRFLSPAEAEYLDALRYYADQSIDLAHAFANDVEHAVSLLEEFPEIGAPFDVDKRRLLLHRFDQSLIYAVAADEIIVIAIHHSRQHPTSWKKGR